MSASKPVQGSRVPPDPDLIDTAIHQELVSDVPAKRRERLVARHRDMTRTADDSTRA